MTEKYIQWSLKITVANIKIEAVRAYNNKKVKCDIVMVPIGGLYSMNYKRAVDYINEIKPQIAIPTYYGNNVEKKEHAIAFINRLDHSIQGRIIL